MPRHNVFNIIMRDDIISAAITPITGVNLDVDTPVWIPDTERAWKPGVIVSKVLQEQDSLITKYNKGDLVLEVETEAVPNPALGSEGVNQTEVVTIVIRGYDKRFAAGDIDEVPELKLRNVVEGGDAHVEDLIKLVHLHEPAILHSLIERGKAGRIYTNTGPILLAMNPFKSVEGLYSRDTLSRYFLRGKRRKSMVGQGTPRGGSTRRHMSDADLFGFALPPHVYTVADDAFRNMIEAINADADLGLRRDQSILVSGESGAGKTETTKIIMRYLAIVASGDGAERAIEAAYSGVQAGGNSITRHSAVMSIERQVLESNPILEAFGNARTIRNDNSSRFGKFIQIQFDRTGTLVGGVIQTYLLEKVRLVSQGPEERNYHIFYEMLAGATPSERERWGIVNKEMASYRYLNQSGCYQRRDGVNDAEQFLETRNALMIMDFTVAEQDDIFLLLSSLLSLGNITFALKASAPGEDAAAEITAPEALEALEEAARLFRVDSQQTRDVLTTRRVHARGETFTVSLSPEKAVEARDGLAKGVYGHLFTHIVTRINEHLSHEGDTYAFIGLLDIFGFEVFEVNSFEQLCINYANECLQHQFNEHIFQLEQSEYEKEGIKWSFIDFPNNEESVELIQGQYGLLRLLDEECLFPRGNDASFAQKLYSRLGNHNKFAVSNFQKVKSQFVVKHYAGDVCYTCDTFIDKNKDLLHEDSRDLLRASGSPLLQKIFAKVGDSGAEDGEAPRHTASATAAPGSLQMMKRSSTISAMSLGTQFRLQLSALVKTIQATQPHYVRCIKPNDNNAPDEFQAYRIVNQLRYSGVLEAVRVARAGYPVRYSHQQFLRQYYMLGVEFQTGAEGEERLVKILNKPEIARKSLEEKSKILLERILRNEHLRAQINGGDSVLSAAQEDAALVSTKSVTFEKLMDTYGFQLGGSKIFLRKRSFALLEQRRAQYVNYSAILIQKICRGFIMRRRRAKWQPAARVLQRTMKKHFCRQNFKRWRRGRAATSLQAVWRAKMASMKFQRLRKAAQTIQLWYLKKTYVQMQREQRQVENAAALAIQRQYRRHVDQSKFQTKKSAIKTIQKAWRGVKAFQSFRVILRDFIVTEKAERERQRVAREEEEKRIAMEAAAKERALLENEILRLRQELMKMTGERDEYREEMIRIDGERGAVKCELDHTAFSLDMANQELADLRKHLQDKLAELQSAKAAHGEEMRSLSIAKDSSMEEMKRMKEEAEKERRAAEEALSKLEAARRQMLQIAGIITDTAGDLGDSERVNLRSVKELSETSPMASSKRSGEQTEFQSSLSPSAASPTSSADLAEIKKELAESKQLLKTIVNTVQSAGEVQRQTEEPENKSTELGVDQATLDALVKKLDLLMERQEAFTATSAIATATPEPQQPAAPLLNGKDPRDALIAHLEDDLERMKAQVESLESEKAAITRGSEEKEETIRTLQAKLEHQYDTIAQIMVEKEDQVKTMAMMQLDLTEAAVQIERLQSSSLLGDNRGHLSSAASSMTGSPPRPMEDSDRKKNRRSDSDNQHQSLKRAVASAALEEDTPRTSESSTPRARDNDLDMWL